MERLFIQGGRLTGKTKLMIDKAIEEAENGNSVTIFASSKQRMVYIKGKLANIIGKSSRNPLVCCCENKQPKGWNINWAFIDDIDLWTEVDRETIIGYLSMEFVPCIWVTTSNECPSVEKYMLKNNFKKRSVEQCDL